MPKYKVPNLGKLGIAILESQVEKIVGEKTVSILRSPLEENVLQKDLANALVRSESRFHDEFTDKKIALALVDLPLANLPSLQRAVQGFCANPADPFLRKTIEFQFETDYPNYDLDVVKKAVEIYLNILREELISTSAEIREKITSLAILGIEKSLEKMTKGNLFFEKIQKAPRFSENIKFRTFKTLIDERTRNFIGRDYILKTIDELIVSKNFSSGYILIHGEPGIGKTSIIAQMVKLYGYVHHFNIATQSICTTRDFLSNICSQLIINYDLHYNELPENAVHDSGFLLNLLSEIVEEGHEQKTIILVDAIDEANDSGLHPNSNRLSLPPVLPEGVFFILTTREQANYRLLVDNRRDIYIADNDPENLSDIQHYIKNFIEENLEDMHNRIATWRISELDFIELLTKKSQGNFMYISYILRDIRDEKISHLNLGNIQNLPVGLRQYYQRHWQSLEEKDKLYFENFEKTVICILATVRESVSIGQLMEWTNQPEFDIRKTINKWKEFLNSEIDQHGQPVYRIYHTSFQDFLREEIGLKSYHELIARSALRKIRK